MTDLEKFINWLFKPLEKYQFKESAPLGSYPYTRMGWMRCSFVGDWLELRRKFQYIDETLHSNGYGSFSAQFEDETHVWIEFVPALTDKNLSKFMQLVDDMPEGWDTDEE